MNVQKLPASLLLLLAAGCASTDTHNAVDASAARTAGSPEAGPQAEGGDAEDKEWELREKAQKLDIAKARHEIAKLQLESYREGQSVRLGQAQEELDMAQSELKKFTEADRPARVAGAELDLRSAKDRAQEAADELAQIELMYAEQDLNDKTAEFVVSRGRRSAERAAARIQIQEAQHKTLLEAELPMNQKRLEMAVRAKVAALEEAQREAKIGTLNKEIAVQEAQQAVAKAERELHKAQGDQ